MILDGKDSMINPYTGKPYEKKPGVTLTSEQVDRMLALLFTEGQKQSTPTGSPLPSWEGQVEITPEDVADALRDWDAKAPKQFRGLLLTERPEG
jgi:hypothetical protein